MTHAKESSAGTTIIEQYRALVEQRDSLNQQIAEIQRVIGGSAPKKFGAGGRAPQADSKQARATQTILATLAEAKEPVPTSVLQEIVGGARNTTAMALWRLKKRGEVKQVGLGLYQLGEVADAV